MEGLTSLFYHTFHGGTFYKVKDEHQSTKIFGWSVMMRSIHDLLSFVICVGWSIS